MKRTLQPIVMILGIDHIASLNNDASPLPIVTIGLLTKVTKDGYRITSMNFGDGQDDGNTSVFIAKTPGHIKKVIAYVHLESAFETIRRRTDWGQYIPSSDLELAESPKATKSRRTTSRRKP